MSYQPLRCGSVKLHCKLHGSKLTPMHKRSRASRSSRADIAAARTLAAPTDRIVREDWERLADTMDLLRADIADLLAEFRNLTPEQVQLLKDNRQSSP